MGNFGQNVKILNFLKEMAESILGISFGIGLYFVIMLSKLPQITFQGMERVLLRSLE